MVPASDTPDTRDAVASDLHLQQLQRMAMLGTLAGGIGHDLRNLVMPILLRLDVLAASKDMPERSRAELASIRDIVTHLQRLAGGLRLLSSDPYQQKDAAQFTQLSEWWREVHVVVSDALTPTTVLTANIPDSLPLIAMPPDVLAQVVVNVVMNARRAMEETRNPELHIDTRIQGNCLYLDISDNGRGMDAETRQRCFEPFFTTRVRGFATGLGLSTGRALLKQYGGDLTLATTAGEGATFTVVMPLMRATSVTDGTLRRRVRVAVGDPRLRALLKLMISNRGLEVVSGSERDVELPVDIIICDPASFRDVIEQREMLSAQGSNAVDTLTDSLPDALRPASQIVVIGIPQAIVNAAGVQWINPQDLSPLNDLLD